LRASGAEQGYGDTLQFSRYASVLAARGARVVLSVPTAVKSLFAAQADLYEVVTPDQTPAFDLHCPLMSAPAICGTELDTIPRSVPYLTADTAAVRRWAQEIASADELPKIGLVWAGRATHHNDANRSIPLGQLGALAELPARWISLQKDIRASDERVLAATPAIHRYDDRLTDFADTAALIMNLDLVITVDMADWRWLHHRQDSPWYPTARLFRQSELRDWLPVVMRVREEMQTFLKNWPMQHRTHRMHG
jgi:hypothetical protein